MDIATLRYGAYGVRSPSTAGSSTAYAGQVPEAGLGIYWLGGRLFSPVLRRFLNTDPLSPFDAGGLNRYAYCAGDPVNRVDPSGHAWKDIFGAIARATANATSAIGSAASASADLVRRSMRAMRDAWKAPRAADDGAAPTIRTFEHEGGTVRVHVGRHWLRGRPRGTMMGKMPDGSISEQFLPRWHEFRNAKGRSVYLPDAPVTDRESLDTVASYLNTLRSNGLPADAGRVVLISGAHGSPSGRNWTASGRWKNRSDVAKSLANVENRIRRGRAELNGLVVVDLSRASREEYEEILDGTTTVFGNVCFLAADEVTMKTLGYKSMDTFVLMRG